MPYLPGHYKMEILRTHSDYLGECFETLEEAQEYVKEEKLDEYYPGNLKIYELVEVQSY